MESFRSIIFLQPIFSRRLAGFLWVAIAAQACAIAVIAHPEITTSDDDTTVTVNDAPEQEVYVIGKSVIVQKRAKGVLAVGGDVTVVGRVEGDVATIGGNVIQKEGAYIGGDVIVFGGSYRAESSDPLREPGKETVMFGVFEQELRNLGQDPSQIFAPSFSAAFVAQRLVLALFWFVLSIIFSTLAPGAVSRAVSRVQLSWLKVLSIGAGTLLIAIGSMVAGALTLPNYLSVTLALMGMLLFLLAYIFGRVSLQVTAGKLLFKYFGAGPRPSETLVTLTGVFFWTVLLSLPYVWLLALFTIFTFGVGLILTGRQAAR